MIRRMMGVFGLAALLAAALLAPPSVRAEEKVKGPAFDCTKAEGTVEKLICADEGLAALDRTLDGVYRAAMVKAKDDIPQRLPVEQRGWIKGRDECWKANGEENAAFLTESWKATSVSECVQGEYRLRISELQAQWQLAPQTKPVFFACEKNPANEVVATFFETEPPTVRLERGDWTVIAWQVPSASDGRYEGQNVVFWNKGSQARVTWRGETLTCEAR